MRGGRGTSGTALELPRSWETALVAYRLADDATPVVDADEYGVLLDTVLAASAAGTGHPDVATLAGIDPHSRTMLETLAHAASVRAAAESMRSEERRVEKECVRTWISRWTPSH